MACFLVPAAEALVVSTAAHIIRHQENKADTLKAYANSNGEVEAEPKIQLSQKLTWLARMLGGGSLLLAFEHLWHGEIVPWFPFLTAAESPVEKAAMFQELFSVGSAMAALVTLVWLGGVLFIDFKMRQPSKIKSASIS